MLQTVVIIVSLSGADLGEGQESCHLPGDEAKQNLSRLFNGPSQLFWTVHLENYVYSQVQCICFLLKFQMVTRCLSDGENWPVVGPRQHPCSPERIRHLLSSLHPPYPTFFVLLWASSLQQGVDLPPSLVVSLHHTKTLRVKLLAPTGKYLFCSVYC